MLLKLAIVCILIGAMLAPRFKVFAVLFAVSVVMAVAVVGETLHAGTGWEGMIAAIVAAASVQLGYLGGAVLWLWLCDRLQSQQIDLLTNELDCRSNKG